MDIQGGISSKYKFTKILVQNMEIGGGNWWFMINIRKGHVLKSVGCAETPCCNATTANGLQRTMIYIFIYVYMAINVCLQLHRSQLVMFTISFRFSICIWCFLGQLIQTLIPMWWLKCWDPNFLCRGTGTPISRSRIRRLGEFWRPGLSRTWKRINKNEWFKVSISDQTWGETVFLLKYRWLL